MTEDDPGPPPERGMVVRPEGEGFYARLWPSPRPDPRRLVPALLVFAALGAGGALVAGEATALRVQVFAGVMLFGVLILAVAFGTRFAPVEITCDDDVVYWHGDRVPMTAVGGCRAVGGRLELLGRDGRVLAAADDLDPDAARWVAHAIRASMPR